jgi:Lar family restriction alleviation protein
MSGHGNQDSDYFNNRPSSAPEGVLLKDELLPCPFCGSANIRIDHDAPLMVTVNCDDCECCTRDHGDAQEATRVWNRRAALAAPSPAETVCYETYAAIGTILVGLAERGHPQAEKLLDNLSEARLVHKDVLPFEDVPPSKDLPMTEAIKVVQALASIAERLDGYLNSPEQVALGDELRALIEKMQREAPVAAGWRYRIAGDDFPYQWKYEEHPALAQRLMDAMSEDAPVPYYEVQPLYTFPQPALGEKE